jgi:hypothetical protein
MKSTLSRAAGAPPFSQALTPIQARRRKKVRCTRRVVAPKRPIVRDQDIGLPPARFSNENYAFGTASVKSEAKSGTPSRRRSEILLDGAPEVEAPNQVHATIFISVTSAYAWKAWARERRRSIIIIREAPRQKVVIKPDLVRFRAVLNADIAEARTKITEPKAEILNRPSLGSRRFRLILLPFRSPDKAEPMPCA